MKTKHIPYLLQLIATMAIMLFSPSCFHQPTSSEVLNPVDSTSSTIQHLPIAIGTSINSTPSILKPKFGDANHPSSPDSYRDVNQNWLAQIQQDMAAKEYAIHWQEDQCAYSSPNRQNNLRITYHEDGFSLKPRVDSLENWKLDYTIAGVYRGEEQVIALSENPTIDACEYELVQHFDHGFHIQYKNSPQGMRQNFIVDEKPAGTGPLKLRLNSKGSLFPVKKGNGDVVLAEKHPLTGDIKTRVWYKELLVLDANGVQVPASMQVTEPTFEKGEWLAAIDLQVDVKDAVYPLLIDPISTTAAAMVESNQLSAQFGKSVASAGDVNGDGYSDVIIVAPYYDNGQQDEGVAFVYHGSPTGIGTIASAMIESNQPFANMNCVSSAGDVNGDGYSDIIVGIARFDNGSTNEGAAYVYHGSMTGIDTTAIARMENNQGTSYFGYSVASAGDINGDGYSDVIVGAPGYNNGLSDEGAFYVYHGSVTGVDTTAATMVESNALNAQLGSCVASAGDVNADGYGDVIVGAEFYSNGQSEEGAAFVYHGNATQLSTVAVAMVESNWINGHMGVSVACAGDVNGDGYSDVIVGVEHMSNPQPSEGIANVYHGSVTGINTNAASVLQRNQDNANFGSSVASAGDVNGDGYGDVIVGAKFYTNGQSSEGAAFVHLGSPSGINNSLFTMLVANQAISGFGQSAASVGDVNGDGYSDVIVGAYGYDNGQNEEGAAFVYHGAPTGISTSATAIIESNQSGALLGYSVASAGDVNGDGFSDVIIGSYTYDNGHANEGAAFVYHGSAIGLNTAASALVESNQTNANMGSAVASAGDVNGDGYGDIIVGAFFYDDGQADEGAAFVYYGSQTGLDTAAVAILECNQITARMGSSVASAGDVNGDGYSDIVVGAFMFDNGQIDEGAAFIYHGSANGIATTPAAMVESNQISVRFGEKSIASAGDVNGDGYSDLVVGASEYDNGQIAEGVAFIYHGSAWGLDTTATVILESNQIDADFGYAVASAGDVNGDGYSDVIIGAPGFSNGQMDEGMAFVYQGSALGINPIASATLEINSATAFLGFSVCSAGDVNGDGYSDVIVGANGYDNGQSNEGAAFVYHGSAAGIGTTAASSMQSNQMDAYFGVCVSNAGDVNGDGYSDIVIGADEYDNGQADEGATFVYYGNGGTGLPTMIQQFRPSSTQPVGPGGLTGSNGQVRFSMKGKSFLGRQKGKLVWETKQNGIPFSSAGGQVTNSIASSGISAAYSDLTGVGTILNEDLSGLSATGDYKWRSRIRYKGTTAITGQLYGPWYYYKSRTPEVPMLGYKPRSCPAMNVILQAEIFQCGYNISCAGANDGTAHATGNGGCPGYTYLWSNGQTSATATGLGAGTMTVTVTDAAGGTSVQSITLTSPTAIQVSATATSSCPGASTGGIDITATGGNYCQGYTFVWSNGATTEDIMNVSAGSYSVTVTDANGCSTIQTTAVGAFPAPTPTISLSGNTFTSVQTWTTYQWLLNGNAISGANANSYTATQTGSYALQVTDTNGCTGVSDTTNITIVGISNAMGDVRLLVYPNPARGTAYIMLAGSDIMPCRLVITDMLGRRLFQLENADLSTKFEINLNDFAAGTYMIETFQGGRRRTVRLVVQ